MSNTKHSSKAYSIEFKAQIINCMKKGESSYSFDERNKEHFKASSAIYDYQMTSGYQTTIDNFSIVEREDKNLARTSMWFARNIWSKIVKTHVYERPEIC